MVISENDPDYYKTLKISIGAIIKKPKMPKFIPDLLKTKKFRFRQNPHKIFEKAIVENGELLMFIPD